MAPKKEPTKIRKLAGILGEAIAVRSPILSQAKEAASIFQKPGEGESRLGNVINAVKQSALNNSVIIRQVAMLADTVKSLANDKPSSKSDKKAPSEPGDKKGDGGKVKDTPTIIEYFDNKENPYFVMMQGNNNYLEQMVELLKQQVDIMRNNLQIDKEAIERATSQKDLDRVSRSNAARALAAQQPRDELGRFIKQDDKGADEGQGGESGWLDTIDDVLDIAKGFKGKIAGAIATMAAVGAKFKKSIMGQASRAGGAIKTMASKIKPLAKKFASSVGTLIDDAGKASKSVLPAISRIAGKGLGLALRAVGSTAFGAAMGIIDPSDLGDGTLEGAVRRNYADELREMGFDPETGEADSPEAEAKARAFIEEKISSGQFVPEGGLPPEEQAAVEANRQRLIDMGYDPDSGEPVTEEAKQNLERIRKERQEREKEEKRMRTTHTPPDLSPQVVTPMPPPMVQPSNPKEIQDYLDSIKQPTMPAITESMSMSKMREYLSFMGNTMQRPATPPPPATPVVVHNQGGPTSVNNGGNVTNIVMGNTSLALPQMAYNLPSSLN